MTATRFTITTFDWVPEFPRGFVRDLRARWALEKARLDYTVETRYPGAIAPNGDLVRWCGIQRENNEHELDVVIGEQGWGIGKAVS